MAELADAYASGAYAARHGSSSLPLGTPKTQGNPNLCYQMMTNQTATKQQATILVPHKRGETEYYLKGTNLKLLILSGMHGDEHEVIQCVEDYINSHASALPEFLFIPKVSPSAVAKRTRKNKYGNDINRQFMESTQDPEARDAMEILQGRRFRACIEFHEDPDRTAGVYVYDSGTLSEKDLAAYRHVVEGTGARLYSGIDDPFDADLGLQVEKGYISTTVDNLPKHAGFSTRWLIANGIAKRIFTPEIPGKAPIALKRRLVEAVFSFFLKSAV